MRRSLPSPPVNMECCAAIFSDCMRYCTAIMIKTYEHQDVVPPCARAAFDYVYMSSCRVLIDESLVCPIMPRYAVTVI